MYTTSAFVIFVFVAVTHARFGQENAVQGIINAIGGNNGQAATLAGASIGTLLAGANACAKLSLADQVAALTGAGALDAAKALVQAEKNTNPFAVSVPSFCSDPTLPATAALRGILPLVDPAFDGSAAENAASAASLTNPVNADGLSIADLVQAQGSVSFTPQSNAGTVGAVVSAGGAASGVVTPATSAASIVTPATSAAAVITPATSDTTTVTPVITDAAVTATTTAAAVATGTPAAGTDTTAATSTNLQTFTGTLGAPASPITFSGDAKRPFEVNGSTFVQFAAAFARTCDIQFNACADVANSGKGTAFADCNTQKTACTAAQASAPITSFDTAAASTVTVVSRDAAAQGAATRGAAAGGTSAQGDTRGAALGGTPADSAAAAAGGANVHQSSRLRKREEAQKRAEKSKRLALMRTILQKRAELVILEEQLM